MFGIGTAIKALVTLIVVAMIAGALWYISMMQANLAIAKENEKKLQDGIAEQSMLLDAMKKDIVQIQETNKQLQEQNEKQKKDVENLSKKFDGKDFGALAAEKPALVERLVNRGTVNAMRCLEIASGSPLNEKEKNAKSPTEANRECPNLIDNDYTAPAR